MENQGLDHYYSCIFGFFQCVPRAYDPNALVLTYGQQVCPVTSNEIVDFRRDSGCYDRVVPRIVACSVGS
jgi:hypothetical protein